MTENMTAVVIARSVQGSHGANKNWIFQILPNLYRKEHLVSI